MAISAPSLYVALHGVGVRRFHSMLDARRMEVYAQVFDRALKEIRPIHADVVDAETVKRAIYIGEFFLAHAQFAFTQLVADEPEAELLPHQPLTFADEFLMMM